MKGIMRRLQRRRRGLTQAGLTLLLVIQALGGGAVTLAHARDVVTAPAAFESKHDARCPVLHDALRCALCHYASAQVVVQRTVITPASRSAPERVPSTHRIVVVASAVHRTAPARAPPALLS
jgi:hypothetical protein